MMPTPAIVAVICPPVAGLWDGVGGGDVDDASRCDIRGPHADGCYYAAAECGCDQGDRNE